jgi:hypothetical protein
MVEAFGKPIDHRHDGIAVTDRQRTTRAKVILYVDHKQQVIVASDPHSSASIRITYPP